jgi:LPS O-antigen subunit length determinant protein (WzzB/FepE family)
MEQIKQELKNYPEDEFNLKALVSSLFEKKILITVLTVFITALAALYANTFTPNYKSTSSFTTTSSLSIVNINKLSYLNETKNSIFTSFLTSVSSQKLQKNVFLENDFITVFNKNNDPIEDIDEFISNILRSIKINPPKLKASDMAIYLDEKPYSISFTGSDKKAISRYLEKLIEHADKENIMELSKLNKLKVGIRLDKISIESAQLIEEERVIRLNQITALTGAAKLARSLGIVENNLNIFRDINAVNIAIGESKNLPDWYLFGETALLQRIDLLVNRPSDSPYIPKLVALNLETDRLKSEHNLSGATSINLISSSMIDNISRSKRQIVLIAFIVGFTMSIFLVLIMSALKPNEKELLPN